MEKVTVDIFGESYVLKTDQDAEYMKNLAALVDRLMREASQRSKSISGTRIGAMAALEIADMYFRLKKDYNELIDMIGDNPAR